MLKHFYLAYYILALTIGFAGVLLNFFRYSIYKYKIDLWHGLFVSSLLLINIGMLGGQYLTILHAKTIFYSITNIISLIASGLTIVSVLQFSVLYIKKDVLSKSVKIISWSALVSTIVMIATYWSNFSDIFTLIQFILLAVAVGYSVLIIVFLYKKYPRKEVAEIWLRIRKYCVFGSSLFIPVLLILDFFPGINSQGGTNLLPGFSPLLLLCWNSVYIVLAIKDYHHHNNSITKSPDWNKYKISPREQEVIIHLLAGHTYKEIAELLFISPGTVKTHILKVYNKTGVSNKTQLGNLLRS